MHVFYPLTDCRKLNGSQFAKEPSFWKTIRRNVPVTTLRENDCSVPFGKWLPCCHEKWLLIPPGWIQDSFPTKFGLSLPLISTRDTWKIYICIEGQTFLFFLIRANGNKQIFTVVLFMSAYVFRYYPSCIYLCNGEHFLGDWFTIFRMLTHGVKKVIYSVKNWIHLFTIVPRKLIFRCETLSKIGCAGSTINLCRLNDEDVKSTTT